MTDAVSSNDTSASITGGTTPTVPLSRIAIGIVLYTVVTVTVFGNLLVLVAVFKDKRLQTVFNYYIVNLAVTDVLVALVAMSLYTTDNILGYWPLGDFMCGIWIFFDYGMTFASVFTLVVISMDRFWSVQWSLHYRQHHNKKKAGIFIALVWIAMLCLWLPPCITDRIKNSQPGVCKWEPSQNREFVIVVASVGHHAAFIMLMFCYVKVFIFMKKRAKIGPISHPSISRTAPSQYSNEASAFETSRQKQINVSVIDSPSNDSSQNVTRVTEIQENGRHNGKSEITQNSQQNQFLRPPGTVAKSKRSNNSQSVDKRERKVFVTLTYIVFGYVVCWLPFHIVFDVSAVDPNAVPEIIYTITFWMTYLNSTINPFLYNFSSPEFRRAFKKILCCKN